MFLHCWRKQFQAMGQGDALAFIKAHDSGPDVWPPYRLLTSPQPQGHPAFHPLLCDARAPHPTVIPLQLLFIPLTGATVVMSSTPPGPWTPHPYGIIPPPCNMALQVSPEPPFPDEELGFWEASYLPRAMWPEHRVGLDHAIFHNTCVSSPSFAQSHCKDECTLFHDF